MDEREQTGQTEQMEQMEERAEADMGMSEMRVGPPLRRPLTLTAIGFAFGIWIQFNLDRRFCAAWIGICLFVPWREVLSGVRHRMGILSGVRCRLKFRFDLAHRSGAASEPIQWIFRSEAQLLTRSAAVLLLASFCAGAALMYLEMGRSGLDLAVGESREASVRGVIEEVQPVFSEKPSWTAPASGTASSQKPATPAASDASANIGGIPPDTAGELSCIPQADYCRIVLRTGLRRKLLLSVRGAPEQLGVGSFADLTGRRAEARGLVSLPQGQRNPGGFDYRLYLRTKNIFALMEVERGGLAVSDTVFSRFFHAAAVGRESFSGRVIQSCGRETGGLLLGMLFGDKSYMDDTLYEEFQKNGAAHLLAVSGIHVTVLYLYIRKLMCGRRDLLPSLLGLGMLLVYAALSGFSPSVMRASLMIGLGASAVLLRRNYDMCTGVAAAALLLLCLQPYRLFDAGFQLSFLAASTLAVILPWADAKWKRRADRLRSERAARLFETATPMVVLQGVMAPATAYLFQNFSWSSFLLNPVLIPLAGVAVPMGIAAFPLSFLPGAAGRMCFSFFLNGAALPVRLMIGCSDFFAERGWGFFAVASPPMGVMILFYGGLFFYCSESRYILRRRGGREVTAAAMTLVLVFSCAFPFAVGAAELPLPTSRQSWPMVFVDVGQGDCMHLRTPGGKNVLIDGGGSVNYNVGKKTLAPYLLKNGVTEVELALATHLHADHYRGIEELAAVLPVRRIGMYDGNRVREEAVREEWRRMGVPAAREPELLYLKKGDRIELDKDIWVEVLAPEQKSDEEYGRLMADDADENASSLVFRVYWQGLQVLVTGDMGFEGEEKLLAQYETEGLSRAEAGSGDGSGDRLGAEAGKGPAAVSERAGSTGSLSAHILKTGHHGSRYSTSEEFLRAVDPEAAVIQVGKNNFGHPAARVIELFQNYDIMTYRTDRQGAILVHSVGKGEAVLSDIREEKIWHISLRRRRSTRIRPFRKT